jgi:enamine deaminase RidA (YjgF/YER057c/UK114 family)
VAAVGEDQLHITASVRDQDAEVGRAAHDIYREVARVLKAGDMRTVHERVFGSLDSRDEILAVRDGVLRAGGIGPERPITFIQGRPLWGRGLAGVQIHAVRPPESFDQIANIVDERGAVCGHSWTRHHTRFLLLQNIHGIGEAPPGMNGRPFQAQRMFDRARQILRRYGAEYHHVVRTWIYLSRILDWYGPFNQARNAKYVEFGLMNGGPAETPKHWLPASTGIEGDNPLDAACVMDVFAVVPDAPLKVEPLHNVRQNEAYDYGSAFSRGMCVREPDVTHILVSGTASIDEEGRSLHTGDAAGQVRRTIDNVQALIAQRDARLPDICEATSFLKRAEDAAVYRRVLAEYDLLDMPAVVVKADVCRDELLFELDALVEFGPPAA